MPGQLVRSTLLLLALGVVAYGQPPAETPDGSQQPAASPTRSINHAPPSSTVSTTTEATMVSRQVSYGGHRFAGTYCNTGCNTGSFDTCGEYFGGFGPLWASYCADKHRCHNGAAACMPPAACPPQGACGARRALDGSRWHALKARLHRHQCASCDEAEPACDCASGPPTESYDPHSIGSPPVQEPEEASKPTKPAPTTKLAPPTVEAPKNSSARRGWSAQKVSWLPRS